jgi:hypothetical protein
MEKLYRSVISFCYVSYVVFFFIPYFDLNLYNQEMLDALTWTGYGALIEFNELVTYLFFLAYTITFIGMMLFKLWAKRLFLILLTSSILLTIIQGVSVLTPIESVLFYLTNLADGATVILLYFTSISSKFNAKT